MCVCALEHCPLNLFFLYNNPAKVCSGQRPFLFDMKSSRKVFDCSWYMSISFFQPSRSAAGEPPVRLSPTASPPPSTDNTPQQVSGCWQKGDCLTLLFAFVSSLFFTNKVFFNKLKGLLPWPIEKMKGGSEVWYNVAGKKEQLIRK